MIDRAFLEDVTKIRKALERLAIAVEHLAETQAPLPPLQVKGHWADQK